MGTHDTFCECHHFSVLLTMGGRSSSEPSREEYPSLVTSIIFSGSKSSPRLPSQVGELSVPEALAFDVGPKKMPRSET